MKQIAAIWSLALIVRRSQGTASMFFVPTLLLLLAMALSSAALLLSRANFSLEYALAPVGAAGAVLILYWWVMYLSTTANLCSPGALQFTPRLRISIPFATVLMWLALSLFILSFFVYAAIFCALIWALVLALLLEAKRITRCLVWAAGFWILCSTGFAMLMPEIVANYFATTQLSIVILVAAVAASVLGWIGSASTYRIGHSLLTIAFVGFLFVPKMNALLVSYFRSADFAMLALSFSLFGVGSIALALLGLVGARGERLAIAYRKRVFLPDTFARLTEPAARRSPVADSGKWPGYTSFLMRALQRNDEAVRLIRYAFGPSSFWLNHIYVALYVCIVIALSRIFVDAAKVRANVAVIGFLLPAVLIPAWMALPGIVFRTRKEQKLLSLTPQWPERATLNQWLGGFIAFQLLVGWIACVFLLMAFALVYQTPLQAILVPAMSGLIMALIVCGYAMMPYANVENRLSHERRLTICAMILAYGSLVLAVAFDGPISMVVSGIGASSLLVALWRWRRLIGGSPALPAGRLST